MYAAIASHSYMQTPTTSEEGDGHVNRRSNAQFGRRVPRRALNINSIAIVVLVEVVVVVVVMVVVCVVIVVVELFNALRGTRRPDWALELRFTYPSSTSDVVSVCI